MPSAARSVVSVLLGFMAMIVLKMLLTPVFVSAMGVGTSHQVSRAPFFAAFALFTFLTATFGGFITAVTAKVKPIDHAAALGALTCIVGFITYHHLPGGPPSWYEWMIGIAPPFCILTGAAFYNPKAAGSDARVR